MADEVNSSRMRFFNDDDGSEITAERLRVSLPDGLSFVIEARPGRDGAALFAIPGGTPQDPTFKGFSIEPGAANVFSVKVIEFAPPPNFEPGTCD